jgi:hypothetical protein
MDALADQLFDAKVGLPEDVGLMENLLLEFSELGTEGVTKTNQEE